MPKQRKNKLVLLTVFPLGNIFQHYSDWQRLLSAVAWILRFISYRKAKKDLKEPKYLTVLELKAAEIVVLKKIQKEVFAKEILELEKGNYVTRNNKLKGLSPYLEGGLILVAGRLRHAQIPKRQKHLLVLSTGHRIAKLILEHWHRESLHL